jgi:DNA (cytosine-5)-methyltransferase 1
VRVLDLFSGIGGFSLGLERAGMETVAFCEIEPYCRAVLRKHWPHVKQYDDVRTLTAERLKADGIGPVDVICGGFPCQDLSNGNAAWGSIAGLDGARSGLWFEYYRLICELRPRFVIVENVAALANRGLDRVLGCLAHIGYDAEWRRIPAAELGAAHYRDRLWIVAYPSETRGPRLVQGFDIGGAGPWGLRGAEDLQSVCDAPFQPGNSWPAPLLRRMDDGVPHRVDRVGACGNAVVPQIPEIIGRAIMAACDTSSSS